MSYINQSAPPPAPRPANTLPIIRMAMTMGVLLFGGVIWFLYRSGRVPPSPDTTLTMVMPYVLGALLAGAIALRLVAAKAASAEQRGSYLIIGWAIGEGAALLGGAHWMLTGNSQWYVIGVFVYLSTLVLLPLTRE